jgi:glycine/D-amino acid oxidase-like deaminating enzyme
MSPALGVARDRGHWRIETELGFVRADRLLVATNAYHFGPALPFVSNFVPMHFFQVATAPLRPAERERVLPGGEGCWDTARVMTSLRVDAQGRLLLGAVGNLHGIGRRIHQRWAQRKLAMLFPWLGPRDIEHSWTGRIAMTPDHIPKIVRLGPGALACFGYSGRGIGPGTTFGSRAARALLDGDERDLPLEPISDHRVQLAGLRSSAYECGAALVHQFDAWRRAPWRSH